MTDGSTISSSTDGIKVSTIYISDTGGNRVVTSTPYRTTSDPTLEWSCTQYDQNGRVVAAAMFTQSSAPDDCSEETNRTAYSTVEYDADRTELTDPASKVREEYRDALGRLTSVMENPGGLNIGASYEYDPVGNLLQVTQEDDGAETEQTREFVYSSLGQLISADNPENGEITYEYNDDGSLDAITDARSIETSFTIRWAVCWPTRRRSPATRTPTRWPTPTGWTTRSTR